jgi:hypothetical protein
MTCKCRELLDYLNNYQMLKENPMELVVVGETWRASLANTNIHRCITMLYLYTQQLFSEILPIPDFFLKQALILMFRDKRTVCHQGTEYLHITAI